jgi:DnaK suppressor protein
LCNFAGYSQVASGELKLATPKVKSKATAKVAKGATSKTSKTKTTSKAAKPTPKAAAKAPPKSAPKAPPKALPKTPPKALPKAQPKATTKALPKAVTKAPPKAAAKAPAKPLPKPVAHAAPKVVAKVAMTELPKPAAKLPLRPPAQMAKPSTVKIGNLLSEAEVIKQAKSDYMSKQQLAFFKYRLLALQAELRENAGATTEHLRELAVAPDPADRATLEEEHALELRTRDRERKLLKKVESALQRIDDGSYGYCEETGEPIGVQRLLARPTATLTIEAQERRELKQKMYGE